MTEIPTSDLRILKRLNTPRKIQDFIERIPCNFEPDGDTVLPPRRVLAENRAHCVEGAVLAALALRLQGRPPLILDMTSAPHDLDHVIAVFQEGGYWGAISKINHVVLRYRDPVYKTIRELVMSYFNEYIDDDGRKTLRSYSRPVDLSRFDKRGWMTTEEEIWYIPDYLCKVAHIPVLNRAQLASLRRADPLELKANRLTQWKQSKISGKHT